MADDDINSPSQATPTTPRFEALRGIELHQAVQNIANGIAGELPADSNERQLNNINRAARLFYAMRLEQNPTNLSLQEQLDYLHLEGLVLLSEPLMFGRAGVDEGTARSLQGMADFVNNIRNDPNKMLNDIGYALAHPIDTYQAMDAQSRLQQAVALRNRASAILVTQNEQTQLSYNDFTQNNLG